MRGCVVVFSIALGSRRAISRRRSPSAINPFLYWSLSLQRQPPSLADRVMATQSFEVAKQIHSIAQQQH